MIYMNIDGHRVLVVRIYVQVRFRVAVVKQVMVVSVLEREANSMDGMSVSVNRNVKVVLSVSVREWWRYMALLKIIRIWPKVPSQIAVSAFELTTDVLVSLLTVFYRLVIVLA